METQIPTTADASQIAILRKKLALTNKIRSGISWFYWIAALSVLNTIIYLFGSSLTFVVGLGMTQFVDGFTSALATQIGQGGFVFRLVGIGLDLSIAGAFAAIGYFGIKRVRWPIIAGMVLYFLDALLLLFAGDYLGILFHAWALFSIGTGLNAINRLKLLEQAAPGAPVDNLFRQPLPSSAPVDNPFQQPLPSDTPQQGSRWFLPIVFILVGLIAIFVVMIFLSR